ncbi:DUF2793 domain-containing protein [Aliiroseovarius sp. PTFE2010]|uniref:DUF2793 domain-containing protein n=1 Tax=Aliiroseovarius sp. PTFE2010 TaxID=3417190 RepID=UPI003CFA8C80
MADTSRLSLPLVAPAQAQKHVTVNEAFARLDGLVQLVLQSVSTSVPPLSAAEGDCWFVPVGAVNDWAGQDGQIALFISGGWAFVPAQAGFRAYIADEGRHADYDGSAWVSGVAASSPNGAAFVHEVIEYDHTLTAGATSSLSLALPAQSIVYGVTGRVITQITGAATSFRVGVAGSDNRYGSGLGLAAGSWLRGLTGTPITYYADEDLVFTGEGGGFTAGAVRVAVHLARLTIPN